MTDTPDFSSILKQALAKIAESEDRAEALRQLMEVIIQLLGAERGFILWKNPSTGELEVQAAHGIDSAQILNPESNVNAAIIKQVVETAKPIHATNAMADSRFQEQASLTGFALRSVIAVPLTVDDETVGVIYCDNRIISGLFQQAELDLIENLIDQVAAAVENLPVDGFVGGITAEEAEPEEDEVLLPLTEADDFDVLSDKLAKKEDPESPPKPAREEKPLAPEPPPAPPPRPQPITPPASAITPGAAPAPAEAAPSRSYGRAESNVDQAVKFAAYHLREVPQNEWKPLVAYVYRTFVESKISEDAGKQLGPLMTAMRRLTQTAKNLIQEGALITATPMLPGFQFNPPSISMAFYEDWQRFDFKLRAKEAPLYQAANGWITFSVEGLIVGDIPLSVYVSDKAQADVPTISATNKLYEAIFCSYSRQDTSIIERVEKAYKALGLDYLRDVESLRSGQHWSDELRALIDRADIFQLFWSPSAAESNFVRMEWEYALKRDRDKANFIRPVYWVNPIPAVPSELSHIHFAYEPGLEA
jgi:GAF domain/TIR domain